MLLYKLLFWINAPINEKNFTFCIRPLLMQLIISFGNDKLDTFVGFVVSDLPAACGKIYQIPLFHKN